MNRYVPNPGADKLIASMPGMQAAMHDRGSAIADAARNLAPIDEGDYILGIDEETGVDTYGALSRVNANDWKSGLIEFGTNSPFHPTFAPLRRGTQQCGMVLSGRNAAF